jgi:hypothetical protein
MDFESQEAPRNEVGIEATKEGYRLPPLVQNKVVGLRQTEQGAVALGDPDLKECMRALSALPTAPVTEAVVLAWVEGPLRRFFPFERFLGSYVAVSVNVDRKIAKFGFRCGKKR